MVLASAFPAYLWGIETKRPRPGSREVLPISSLPMRNWNTWTTTWTPWTTYFQPTYEELKLYRRWPGEPDQLISSLPMRNWNAHSSPWGLWWFVISSLPMRNWNRLRQRKEQLRPSFPAYLWGIETHPPKPRPLSPVFISSLPMRNWNKSSSHV